MLKKYGLVILFSIFIMLAGVMLLSLQDEIKKVDQNIEEDIEDGQEADAATINITIEIGQVYGMPSSVSGATISGWVGLQNKNGETHNSKSYSMSVLYNTEKVISVTRSASYYYRYMSINGISFTSAATDGDSTLRLDLTYVTSTDSQGGTKGPELIQNYRDDCDTGYYTGGARFTITIFWGIYYSLNANGGSGGNGSVIYSTYHQQMYLYSSGFVNKINVPTRTGYTFKGYYTSSGTQVINENGEFCLNRSSAYPAQLYAKWQANTYNVNFDATNLASYSPVLSFNAAGGSINTSLSGNELLTAINISSTQNNWSGVYISVSSLTIGKKYDWSIDIKSTHNHPLVLIGHEQGGTLGDVSISTSWQTVQYTFVASSNTRQAFVIYSNNLSPGETIYIKNLTLQESDESVTPADQAIPSMTYTYDSTYSTLPTPTRFGYNFVGWYTAKSGGTQITTSTKVTTASNHTLYSHWEAKEYSINLDANGGSVTQGQIKVTYLQPYGTLPTATRDGYTFKGWWTDPSGGSEITSSSTFTLGSDQTLYAHWEANTYRVNFETNNIMPYPVTGVAFNGSGGVLEYRLENNEYIHSFTFTDNVDMYGASTGFYIGLSALTTGEEYVWSVYVKSTRAHAISLGQEQSGKTEAQVTTEWTRITYRFTASAPGSTAFVFYRGAGSWAVGEKFEFKNLSLQKVSDITTEQANGTITVTYDQYYTNLPTPTRYGYNFDGWYTAKTGGSLIQTTTKVSTTSDQILYAHWAAKSDCVLTFNANGGEVSEASRNQTYNAVLGTLPIPTRTGYIFTGWYTSASGGSEVTSSTKMTSLTMTIYAHWIETWADHVLKPNGEGTADNPYKIENAENLAWIINNHSTQYYKLTNHIDMSKYYWEPIGTVSQPFAGIIDGQGYTIYGLHTISQSLRRDNGGDNSGLFGVTKNAIITNLYIKDAEINGKNSVGGIIGSATNGTITSVAIEGQINGQANIGGIAGTSSGTTINDCLIIITGTTSSTNNGLYTGTATLNNTLYRINGIQGESEGTFDNWVYVYNMEYPLPSGLSWLASGGEIDDKILKLWSSTNLIPNGGMEGTGWNVNGSSISYSKEQAYSGEYSVKIIGSTTVPEVLLQTSTGIILDPTHKYYVSIYGYQDQKVGDESVDCYWPIAEPHMGSIQSKEAGQWQHYSWLVTRTSFTSGTYPLRFDFNNQRLNTTIYYDNAKMIDLTAIFGAGNEPTQAWLDQHINFINV